MNSTSITAAVRDAIALVLMFTLVFIGLFISLEPVVTQGQDTTSEQFNVTMSVSDEIAFTTSPSPVALTPTPSGITGGTANGNTEVAVRTNATLGYNMTITASSSDMVNVASSSIVIPAYVPDSVGVPDRLFVTNLSSNPAQFAFSVASVDAATLFRHNNGAGCNEGAINTVGECWLDLDTSPITIVNRTTPTDPAGATSSIQFRVNIPEDPDPAVVQGNYRATTTLTITNNS